MTEERLARLEALVVAADEKATRAAEASLATVEAVAAMQRSMEAGHVQHGELLQALRHVVSLLGKQARSELSR